MDNNCTIYKTADFIGKKWTILILLELHKGKEDWKRFNELKRSVSGITSKVLSLRLKELENEGLIKTSKNDESSKYTLTTCGKEFIKIIQDMKKWALIHKFKNKTCEMMNCKNCDIEI